MLRIILRTKNNKSLDITHLCKMSIDVAYNRKIYKSNNFPLEIIYLPEDKIPSAIERNLADIAIITTPRHPANNYTTLRTNNFISLIARNQIESHITFLLDEFLKRWDAVFNATTKCKLHICVENKILDTIIRIIHCQNLTITPVYRQEKSIIECIIDEKHFWDIEEELRRLKSGEIAILPLSKLL